jgi:type III pantothenate kinase
MILLIDVGNTHSHVGLANGERIVRQFDLATKDWRTRKNSRVLPGALKCRNIEAAVICSVVPAVNNLIAACVKRHWRCPLLQLTSKNLLGVGIDYPKPETIGPDRLANAVAARHFFGAPAVVVDFGTAVTFDVVDSKGNYTGGIIAPGLSAMTDYLHEKTALLPRIKIRETTAVIGKNTEQAMLIGAVHGYRGLIRELILELKRALKVRRLPVVATGGYAKLIAAKLPEINAVDSQLTLHGLRLVWEAHVQASECECGGERACHLTDSIFSDPA